MIRKVPSFYNIWMVHHRQHYIVSINTGMIRNDFEVYYQGGQRVVLEGTKSGKKRCTQVEYSIDKCL